VPIKLLPLLLLLVVPGLQAEQCQTNSEGLCNIFIEDSLPSGKRFKLEVAEAPLKVESRVDQRRTGYWGANGGYPDSYIEKISLVVEQSKLSIPSKVFTDLGNLTFVEIKENEHAIAIIVKGGEASAAYYATFLFVDEKIIKRTVRSVENPDQLWERTAFYEPD